MADTVSLREQIARRVYARRPLLVLDDEQRMFEPVPFEELDANDVYRVDAEEIADIAIAVIASRQPSREEFDAWANDFMALDTDDDSENVVAFVRRCMASAQAFEGLMDRALIGDKT